MTNTLELEPVPQSQAVAVVQHELPAVVPAPEKQPVTAAQAKVEAIASLTMAAYAKAGMLQLTPEETEKLAADFPDEAFKPGAAGKENLIYIEHAFLRDRLIQVFGIGQWALVPRSRWAEDFMTKGSRDKAPQPGSRVYVEAMLVVRGCFVSEAIGEMEYYPGNAAQNYGDAVEGAKTAALRRCCKELGVGLQAWKKDWCEGWWQRKRSGGRTPAPIQHPRQPAPTQTPKPDTQVKPAEKPWTQNADNLTWVLTEGLKEFEEATITEYLQAAGILLPTESAKHWPLDWLPTGKADVAALKKAIEAFVRGDPAEKPYKCKLLPEEAPKTKDAPAKEQAVKIDPSWRMVSGVIDHVSYKRGTKKNGQDWENWGIKVGDLWYGTFSRSIGQIAEAAKGCTVQLYYSINDRGNTAEHIAEVTTEGESEEYNRDDNDFKP